VFVAKLLKWHKELRLLLKGTCIVRARFHNGFIKSGNVRWQRTRPDTMTMGLIAIPHVKEVVYRVKNHVMLCRNDHDGLDVVRDCEMVA